MAFTPKDWKDYPDTTTPITAAAIEDLETRLSAYTDGQRPGLTVTANDAADLVAKLAQAGTAGGGDVYVPNGTYSLTTVTGPAVVRSGVRLRMAPLAIITQAASQNMAALVESYDYASQLSAYVSNAEKDFAIEGGTIDGNASNNTGTTIGLRLYAYRYSVRDLRITNCDGQGFTSDWNDASPATTGNMEAHISNVWISYCNNTGFLFQGPHDSVIESMQIARITGGDGAYFSGKATGTQVTDMHTWSTTAGYGIKCETSLHFANCQAEGGLLGNVYVNSGIIWTGGRVFDKDTFGSSAHKGFVWGPNGFGCTISGVAVSECNEGAFDFTAGTGGNSRINANVWHSRASQSVVVGSPSDSVDWDLHVNFTSLTSVTATASTDRVNKTAHGLTNNQTIQLRSGFTGGTGLTAGTTYYVVNATTNDFQVSLTNGGAAVDITVDGSNITLGSYLGFTSTTKKRRYSTRGYIAATTPGSVQGKIQVLDEYGNSLGYIPLYTTIT